MSEIKATDERRGKTSASNAEADDLCPGRFLAQAGLPDVVKDSADRDTGNRIHEALAIRDPSKLSVDDRDIYDSCVAIEDKKVAEFFGADAPAARAKVWVEQRFWVRVKDANTGAIFEHSGKPDRVYRHANKALAVEYKTLKGDVPSAPSNLQLRDQAVLIRGHFIVVDEIGTVVIQPMVTHDPVICTYKGADLKLAESRMFNRVRASNNPQSPRVAGEKQCQFCRAKHGCLQYQQWAGSQVPGMLTILDVAVDDWTPQQRKIFCDRRGIAKKWLEETEDKMKEFLERDKDGIPGWGLSPGRRVEAIKDPQKVFERFATLGGKIESFMQCITVGKTKLKEQLSSLTGARGKALENAMATLTDGVVETSITAPSLKKLE